MARVDRSRLPAPGPDPRFRFPEIVRHTLANGLKIRTVEHPGVPIVTFVIQIDGGLGADPAGHEGLAAMTADTAPPPPGAQPPTLWGDLDRYRAASPHSLRAAARNYLAFDRRVLLSIVPRGQAALALPGSEPVAVS